MPVAVKTIIAGAAKVRNARHALALPFAVLVIAGAFAGAALAAGPHADGDGAAHGHDASLSFGQPATAAEATRTVDVAMHDAAFEPERIDVKAGDTVRFVVRNDGQLVHEFNVGTPAMHSAHQKEMAMMVDHGILEADKINHSAMMSGAMGGGGMMMHDDPNSVLLEPGRTGEVVLKFTRPMTLQFACNVPGHYEAGMVGTIDVAR